MCRSLVLAAVLSIPIVLFANAAPTFVPANLMQHVSMGRAGPTIVIAACACAVARRQ
jgi:hypothetical protein